MRRRSAAAAAVLAATAMVLRWRAIARAEERAVLDDPERTALFTPLEGEVVAVTSADGTVLHAELFGPAEAPTVVLVHGWMCSLEMWTYQIRDLIPDHRVVAYDLRGHADSAPAADGEYSTDALAADLDAVLAACLPEGRRAVMVGHSMGAMSVVAWAGTHRHDVGRRLSGAVLLNTGVERLVAEARVVITAAALSRVKNGLGSWLLDLPLPHPGGRRLSSGAWCGTWR